MYGCLAWLRGGVHPVEAHLALPGRAIGGSGGAKYTFSLESLEMKYLAPCYPSFGPAVCHFLGLFSRTIRPSICGN
jgi:hypothetical protein